KVAGCRSQDHPRFDLLRRLRLCGYRRGLSGNIGPSFVNRGFRRAIDLVDNGDKHRHKTDQHDTNGDGQKPDHFAAHTFHGWIKRGLALFIRVIALLIVLITRILMILVSWIVWILHSTTPVRTAPCYGVWRVIEHFAAKWKHLTSHKCGKIKRQ